MQETQDVLSSYTFLSTLFFEAGIASWLIIFRYIFPSKRRGLELHCTILREKELQLYTSTGMVGSAAVSSGPLVDAISRWDVRKSHAAEVAYKRQIMNFIAETLQKRRNKREMIERVIMKYHERS